MRIYCPNCWHDYPDDVAYCAICGAPLSLTPSGEDYVTRLIRALRHPEPMTVERAATLLGRIGDRRAAEPLLTLLAEDAAPEALAAAALSLAALHELRAVPLLAGRLADPASYLWVRQAAVRALAQLGGPAAEVAIRWALDDPSPSVRDIAVEALAQYSAAVAVAHEVDRCYSMWNSRLLSKGIAWRMCRSRASLRRRCWRYAKRAAGAPAWSCNLPSPMACASYSARWRARLLIRSSVRPVRGSLRCTPSSRAYARKTPECAPRTRASMTGSSSAGSDARRAFPRSTRRRRPGSGATGPSDDAV